MIFDGRTAARVRIATGTPGTPAARGCASAALNSASPPQAPCARSGASRTPKTSLARSSQPAATGEAARKASSAASSSHTANSAQRHRSADSVIVCPRPVPISFQKRSPAVRRSNGRSSPIRDNPCAALARG